MRWAEPTRRCLTGLDLARAEEWLPTRAQDLSGDVTAFAQRSIAVDCAAKDRAADRARAAAADCVLDGHVIKKLSSNRPNQPLYERMRQVVAGRRRTGREPAPDHRLDRVRPTTSEPRGDVQLRRQRLGSRRLDSGPSSHQRHQMFHSIDEKSHPRIHSWTDF